MYLLENLWMGNVTLREEIVQDGSLYQEISLKSIEYLEKFRKELSPEGKKALEEDYNAQMQLGDISDREAFAHGVCFGAKFILDVIGNDIPRQPRRRIGYPEE